MKTVKVAIEESFVQNFDVEIGDNEDESFALEKAIEQYEDGELIVKKGKAQVRQIAIIGPFPSEWDEF